MVKLSSDETFHFEILRILALSREGGAQVNEVLLAADKIKPGDFETFHDAFKELADRVYTHAKTLKHPVSLRDAMFHASSYYRAADFYVHGNWDDPRINDLWDKQTECFNTAISLLPAPGQRKTLEADGFKVETIFYPVTANDTIKRPTIILGNGFDGAQEEMYHKFGFPALQRGYNVITYEGPGQCTVRRQQKLGFIAEWEKVVTPVVDYLETLPTVDMKRIGLLGNSMAGCLAARAAAFEHRISAVFLVDGVYDVGAAFRNLLGQDEEPKQWAQRVRELIEHGKAPTTLKWVFTHGPWAFHCEPEELLDRVKPLKLEGCTDQIQCPVWIGNAANDIFFDGQPEQVRDALGERGHYVRLTDEDAAGSHCHVGAGTLLNQLLWDWFEDINEVK